MIIVSSLLSPRLAPVLASTLFIAGADASLAADLVQAHDGSGVFGYKHTPVLPWCDFHVHDPDRPNPPRIAPVLPPDESRPAKPPTDAIILFDGNDLSKWQASDTVVRDGCLVAGDGNLTTQELYGAIQLHLEWMAPPDREDEWYNRGNNGVMLMGLYEVQIFDSYNVKIYPDGMAAAIYGQTPPRVNVCRKPGEWNYYDILFLPPKFDGDRLVEPARLTMLHNGVLVHLNEVIHGETGHQILPEYKQKVSSGPIVLAGHHCPVRFRNIWVRQLESRPEAPKAN
jgi:hypothetical protein